MRTAMSLALLAALQLQPHGQRAPKFSEGDTTRGRIAFMDLRCNTCHRVAEDPAMLRAPGAWEGPLLHDLGKEPPEAVAWRIVMQTSLDPESAYETPMAESATQMTERQLVDVVAYLRNPRAARK